MIAEEDKIKHRESHGLRRSKGRLYNIWTHIKCRCLDPKDKHYKNYGGRGIKMCSEWKYSFSTFVNWAEQNGYKPELTIERINVDGNYTPENCKWATRYEQNRNKRDNVFITFNGETLCRADMAKKYGLSNTALKYRLAHGWSLEDALLTKPGERRGNRVFLTFKGITLPFCKMAEHYGLKPTTLKARLKYGWSLEDALTKTVNSFTNKKTKLCSKQ